tara:strand:+ start:1485 stop:2432 length:948 start_codon:yes stop_codon:yes gene_type:complete
MNVPLLNAVVPVFLIMTAGYVFRRNGWIKDGLDSGIMQLSLNLLMPCLILDKIIGSEIMNHLPTVGISIALGFGIITSGIFICLLAAPILGLGKGSGKRTFAIATAIQNYGFVSIPVLVTLFGEGPLGLLFLHGMGVELATWTIAVMVLCGFGNANWRSIINGPFIAVITSLTLHYAGADAWLPIPLRTFMANLGTCAVPMCLLAIGITIADQSKSPESSLRWPTVLGACILRLAILPALILLITQAIPAPEELKQVMLVQAAMPAAVFPIVLARIYGGHPATAIQIVLATTIGSLISMPIILHLGAKWLGLELP